MCVCAGRNTHRHRQSHPHPRAQGADLLRGAATTCPVQASPLILCLHNPSTHTHTHTLTPHNSPSILFAHSQQNRNSSTQLNATQQDEGGDNVRRGVAILATDRNSRGRRGHHSAAAGQRGLLEGRVQLHGLQSQRRPHQLERVHLHLCSGRRQHRADHRHRPPAAHHVQHVWVWQVYGRCVHSHCSSVVAGSWLHHSHAGQGSQRSRAGDSGQGVAHCHRAAVLDHQRPVWPAVLRAPGPHRRVLLQKAAAAGARQRRRPGKGRAGGRAATIGGSGARQGDRQQALHEQEPLWQQQQQEWPHGSGPSTAAAAAICANNVLARAQHLVAS